jgi:hypothetical protein
MQGQAGEDDDRGVPEWYVAGRRPEPNEAMRRVHASVLHTTSITTRLQDGTSSPRTRNTLASATPPPFSQGHSHAAISGGRCPKGWPVPR